MCVFCSWMCFAFNDNSPDCNFLTFWSSWWFWRKSNLEFVRRKIKLPEKPISTPCEEVQILEYNLSRWRRRRRRWQLFYFFTYPQPFLSNSFSTRCCLPAGAVMPMLLVLLILCGPHASSDNVGSRVGLDAHPGWLHTHGSAETNRRSNDLRPKPETCLICHDVDVYVPFVSFMTCYDCSKCICLDEAKYWDDTTTANSCKTWC